MKIFRAIGIGVFLLVLEVMVPPIFKQFETTTVAFLQTGEVSANSVSSLAAAADASHLSQSGTRLVLPQAPTISTSATSY